MDVKEKELLQQIKELHSQIQNDSKQSLNKALKLGAILETQKKRVGHGNFIPWVNKYLPFSERTSRNYLLLHKNKKRSKSQRLRACLRLIHYLGTNFPTLYLKIIFMRMKKIALYILPKK